MRGRKPKIPLPYFPLYCNMGDSVEYLEAQCGLIGFAVLIKLFQKIYGERGYYCEFNEKIAVLFAGKIKTGAKTVIKTVEISVQEGIFSEEMYRKHGILTSERIQETYLTATSRRTDAKILPEYALVDCAHFLNSVDENSNPVDKNSNSADTNSQKKEEMEIKNINPLSSSSAQDTLVITNAELAALHEHLSDEELNYYIGVVVEEEKQGHHYTKKSHCQAILDMAKADGKLASQQAKPKFATPSKNKRKVSFAGFDAQQALEYAMRRSYGEITKTEGEQI